MKPSLRQRIAKTLRDGNGQVKCCYSNGCNSDLETVNRSLQYLDRPMNSAEIHLIQQKAENIQRLRELEQDRAKEILGRTSLAKTDQQVMDREINDIEEISRDFLTRVYYGHMNPPHL